MKSILTPSVTAAIILVISDQPIVPDSIFKRGMRGIYQHCAKKHLHRYVAEFNFRYSNRVALGYNDADRADALLQGIIGKRLTYQTASARA